MQGAMTLRMMKFIIMTLSMMDLNERLSIMTFIIKMLSLMGVISFELCVPFKPF
jgi:hypothetical protein